MRSPRSGKVRFGNTWHKRGHTRWEGKRGEAMIWVTFASYRCAATTLTSPSIQRTRAEELRLLKRQVLILLVLGGDFARSPLPSRIRARERRGREEGGRIWRRRIITILAGRGVHGRQLPFLQRCSFGCQPANITRSSLSHSTTALILGARLIGSKCLSDHNAKWLWKEAKILMDLTVSRPKVADPAIDHTISYYGPSSYRLKETQSFSYRCCTNTKVLRFDATHLAFATQ